MISDFSKKQKRGLGAKNYYFVAGAILFLSLSVLLVIKDIKIYREKKEFEAQLINYEKQVQEIKNRNNALKEGIARSEDKDYVEKVAREELGLQKQGENVVAFVMPPAEKKQEENKNNFWQNFTGWLSGIFKR